MNGSRSNSSSVAPLRADTLFSILIGIFIAIGGGLTAMVGGKIPLFNASTDKTASTAPEAPKRCPVMDFVELILTSYA